MLDDSGGVPGSSDVRSWRRVTERDRCPICGNDSWCTVEPGGAVVRCKREPSPTASPGNDGEAWLHFMDGTRAPQPTRERKPSGPEPDWGATQRRLQQALTPELTDELAAALGVDKQALTELGLGHDGSAWTFPMYGANGAVCGIKLRMPDGGKRSLPRSKLGVFRRATPDDGLLLVCEGESDTAAALSLGFDAIGVSGAGQTPDVVAVYCRDRDVVLVGDRDEAGDEGVAKLLTTCAPVAKKIRAVRPPEGWKDLRAWHNSGSILEALHGLIAQAKPVSRGVILDAWGPLRPGVLSTMPEPRTWLFRHPTRDGAPVNDRSGDGLLPLGKVGLLCSAGGVGKTAALIAMAVSIVTGRRWLSHFDPDPAVTGDVLLALAEEDQSEIDRRLYDVSRAMELSEPECREVERRLVALPLVGQPVALAMQAGRDELRPTTVGDQLLRCMRQQPGRKWALVALDPLSRFAGIPIDADNAAATFVVQQCERLAIESGATVLVAHHSSKAARKEGRADSRGASGIEDAVRWVATLTATDDGAKFLQTKSNYSRPMLERDAVVLVKERGGILRAKSGQERLAEKADTEDRDIEKVIDAVRRMAGTPTTRDTLVKAAGIRTADGRAVVDLLVGSGRITVKPDGRLRIYGVLNGTADGGVHHSPSPSGTHHTPHTPRDGGTAEASPSGTVGDGGGTAGRRDGKQIRRDLE